MRYLCRRNAQRAGFQDIGDQRVVIFKGGIVVFRLVQFLDVMFENVLNLVGIAGAAAEKIADPRYGAGFRARAMRHVQGRRRFSLWLTTGRYFVVWHLIQHAPAIMP